MKAILVLAACCAFLFSEGQQWQLSGQSTFYSFISANGLAAERVYISVLDNNGTAVTGLKAVNFVAFGETCPDANHRDACSFVELEQLSLLTVEQKPGLYSMVLRTKNQPGSVIKTIFMKVYSMSPPVTSRPHLIQHGQIVLTPIN